MFLCTVCFMFLHHVRIHIKQIAMTTAQIMVVNFRIDCNDNLTSCSICASY